MGYPAYGGFYRSSMKMVNKGVDTKFQQIRKDFKAIDFSENEFGNIPQSLANLTNLEELDLSRNQLSGQIPSELGSLSFLSIMNFSHNNLEGPIPQSTQFQRQNCSAFMYNSNLYGLEDICGKTHVPNPTPQESEDLSKPKEQFPLRGSDQFPVFTKPNQHPSSSLRLTLIQILNRILLFLSHSANHPHMTMNKERRLGFQPAIQNRQYASLASVPEPVPDHTRIITASDNHPVTATDNHPVTARLTVPAINLAFQYALSSVSIAIRTTIQMTCPTYLSRLISPTLDWGTGMLQIAYGPGDEVLTWQQQKNKKSDLAPAEEKKDFGFFKEADIFKRRELLGKTSNLADEPAPQSPSPSPQIIVVIISGAVGLSLQYPMQTREWIPNLNRTELETVVRIFSNIIEAFDVYTLYEGTLSSGVEIVVASTVIS
ncbi:hypothetical protein DY000_02009538 [Brassica cretica]|uniref:Uncharacterized protein n=1 Tax=Brassica cretica TaxID=69181 RepID=A0ABQ7C2X9_BRACR|nr:hypothetical protein DY000_02009538 [Brassica cretica]